MLLGSLRRGGAAPFPPAETLRLPTHAARRGRLGPARGGVLTAAAGNCHNNNNMTNNKAERGREPAAAHPHACARQGRQPPLCAPQLHSDGGVALGPQQVVGYRHIPGDKSTYSGIFGNLGDLEYAAAEVRTPGRAGTAGRARPIAGY